MAELGDVGKKHADLAILDASGAPAILRSDARRVTAPFGEAAFIQDQHGEERGGISRRRLDWRRLERLANKRSQFIAYACVVPGGSREQALHAIRSRLSDVFGDLPAIFAGNLAENGLQVEPGMLVWFEAREMGTQTLMQLVQANLPTAYGTQGGPDRIRWSMVKRLHAFLAFDGSLNSEVLVLLACHIGARMAVKRPICPFLLKEIEWCRSTH